MSQFKSVTTCFVSVVMAIASSHGQTITSSTEPYGGIRSLVVSVSPAESVSGRAYSFNAVEINLSTPGISFRVSPPNTSGGKEVQTQKTKDFANQIGNSAVVAINTSFFEYNAFNQFLGAPYASNLTGVSVSGGIGVSAFETNHPSALNISSDNVATFITTGVSGGYTNTQGISLYNTIGLNGPALLVDNGAVNTFIATDGQSANKYPGVALFNSGSGSQRLVLLASSSITFKEMAAGFQFLATGGTNLNAMFLDGGGSTSFYLRDPSSNNLGALVDSSRLVGSSLAVIYTIPEPATSFLFLCGALIVFFRYSRIRAN